jgi:ribonuclease HI
MNIIIHTDGGSRGNPGPAAVGVLIEEYINDTTKKYIVGFGKVIGETTNNVAEYKGVVEALTWLLTNQKNEKMHVHCYLDSMLVVNQLNGLFKVKDHKMRELMMTVRQLEQELGGEVTYTAVPREQNKEADALVNEALDQDN